MYVYIYIYCTYVHIAVSALLEFAAFSGPAACREGQRASPIAWTELAAETANDAASGNAHAGLWSHFPVQPVCDARRANHEYDPSKPLVLEW